MSQSKENIAVYILCGGKSTRMQEEKGLVDFQGKPFIQWILEAVFPLSSNITLVTKNKAYQKFGFPLISDLQDDKGPVGGIYTALAHSDTQTNLILSCDIPKITTNVLSELITQAKNCKNSICFLTDGLHDYPLIGCYSKSLLPVFAEAVLESRLKLCPLVNEQGPKKLFVYQKNQSALTNINSKAELHSLT